jgi:hypothetical protein
MSALDVDAGEWYLVARRGKFPAAQLRANPRLHVSNIIDAKSGLGVYLDFFVARSFSRLALNLLASVFVPLI